MKVNPVMLAYVLVAVVLLVGVKSLVTSWITLNDVGSNKIVTPKSGSISPEDKISVERKGQIGTNTNQSRVVESQEERTPYGENMHAVRERVLSSPGNENLTPDLENSASHQDTQILSSSIARGTVSAALTDQQPNRAASVMIPAAFGDPAAAGITSPDQVQEIAQLANDFTRNVQQSGVSPTSPAYTKMWNKTAKDPDAYLKQQIGWQAFDQLQQSTKSP